MSALPEPPPLSQAKTRYTPNNILALEDLGRLGEKRALAGARALLRSDTHLDNAHFDFKDGGLHRAYLNLDKELMAEHNTVEGRGMLVNATFYDVLDALTIMDRIDGGISIVLRVPGSLPDHETLSVENIRVDTYLPPREIEQHRVALERPIARLVQIFGQEIALPHLRRFEGRCKMSGVEPPVHAIRNKTREKAASAQLLPNPAAYGSSHFQFLCRYPGVLEALIANLEDIDYDRSDSVDWEAAHYACQDIEASESKVVSTSTPIPTFKKKGNRSIDKQDPFKFMGGGDASDSAKTDNPPNLNVSRRDGTQSLPVSGKIEPAVLTHCESALAVMLKKGSDPSPPVPLPTFRIAGDPTAARLNAIISIGPQTDVILDQLRLSDKVVPYLHVLVQFVRSSRWSDVLERPEWGLAHGDAVLLANALLSDTKKSPNSGKKARSSSCLSCWSLMLATLALALIIPFYS